MEHFVHLSLRQSADVRGRGHSDVELLLKGTPQEIGDHVAESVRRALENGDVSEIRLIPVHPGNVWNLATS